MLLGDFLLTATRDRAGLRKKVHRLQPNLVVGWPGNLVAAEYVLTRFREAPVQLNGFRVEHLKMVGWRAYQVKSYVT
jgi:hypothetical protein